MTAGYTMSTGNNAPLAASGQRARGGPDQQALVLPGSAPVRGQPGTDSQSPDWMNWPWTPWTPVPVASRTATGCGLYRIRDTKTATLIYVGQGNVAFRLRAHLAKARTPAHRQAASFSGDLQASWIELPGTAALHLFEHENDLIAAHVLATGHAPAAQFLG